MKIHKVAVTKFVEEFRKQYNKIADKIALQKI